MQLIVTEKPSVAQSIAEVLGVKEKANGFYQGTDYLIFWCVGHLVELAPADSYDEKYAKWRYETLPIIPDLWQFIVPAEKSRQFSVLRKLMSDSRVTSIICATDAGREGELIFRLVYNQAGCRKTVRRLWINSLEDEAIRAGMNRLQPLSAYDKLYQAALCRAQTDWLVGINATRLFSVLYRQTLPVGRVMTPTLAMLVTREHQIDAFKPESFYTVNLVFDGFFAAGSKLKERSEAEVIRQACMDKEAGVTKLERKDKQSQPPRLFDLTTLQREANRLLGYTAQQTLDYAQSLYEKKLLTYPRTDSRYLSSDLAVPAATLLPQMKDLLPFIANLSIEQSVAQLIKDDEVTDHHAILPTMAVRNCDLKALPQGELEILTMVMTRLLAAAERLYLYQETVIELACGGQPFKATRTQVKQPGWKAIEKAYLNRIGCKSEDEEADSYIPELATGQVLKPSEIEIKDGKTTPPKHFTEDTLLAAMEKASREDLPDDARHGLGTPATRAGIIEKLVRTGLVKRHGNRKKVALRPTHKGISLITVMPDMICSPQLTADWEKQLYLIEKGEADPQVFIKATATMIRQLIATYQAVSDAPFQASSEAAAVGTCPRCGDSVIERDKLYGCQNQACRFALWKDSRFFTSKKIKLTRRMVTDLLQHGQIELKNLYSPKTGKTYDATVLLVDDGQGTIRFQLIFPGQNETEIRKDET